MKLGENILKLRKQHGLSQEQLGERINVTRQTISNWELDETTPNFNDYYSSVETKIKTTYNPLSTTEFIRTFDNNGKLKNKYLLLIISTKGLWNFVKDF